MLEITYGNVVISMIFIINPLPGCFYSPMKTTRVFFLTDPDVLIWNVMTTSTALLVVDVDVVRPLYCLIWVSYGIFPSNV